MTVNDYKQQYNAEIECEASKQLQANNRRNTIRKKYSVDNIFQILDIKQKIHNSFIKTLLEKYNTTNIMHIPEFREKMRNKIKALWNDPMSRYNSINYGQFSNIHPNNTEQKIIDLQIPNLCYTGNFSF